MWIEWLVKRFSAPRVISRKAICLAFAVAIITDGLQFALGPFGWVLIDEGLDILAMILISWAIGFHMLLLPTFVIELIPGPDMLPTWTGCTAAVVMLRKRSERQAPIDVSSEVTPVEPAPRKDGELSKPPVIPEQTARPQNT